MDAGRLLREAQGLRKQGAKHVRDGIRVELGESLLDKARQIEAHLVRRGVLSPGQLAVDQVSPRRLPT